MKKTHYARRATTAQPAGAFCVLRVSEDSDYTHQHTHTHSKGAGWSVHITLAPGNYEFKFLLDDTAWAHDQTKVCCICMYTYIYYNVSLI